MISRGDVISYRGGDNFRDVVLEEILKNLENKLIIKIVKTSGTEKRFTKFALTTTIDSTACEIVRKLIKEKIKNLKGLAPVNKNSIKILYLFLDKEVLLYAKLKKLKYNKINPKEDSINLFIDELEKKHPEVKRAIVNNYLSFYYSKN
jgi:tRNA(Ile)-lysidine synthase TilS/MesJ